MKLPSWFIYKDNILIIGEVNIIHLIRVELLNFTSLKAESVGSRQVIILIIENKFFSKIIV